MTLDERLVHATARSSASFLLTGDDAGDPVPQGTPAAVLVPVVRRSEPGLLLTVRTASLRHHAGQIAFPGGRIDGGETARQAALREAREEIGLDPAAVAVVGVGDPYRTVTGFAVIPVIALIEPDLPLRPGDGEVTEIFEAPLAHVTDPANQHLRTVDWQDPSRNFQGRSRSFYEIPWGERRIWGATAAMIVNLSRRLARAE